MTVRATVLLGDPGLREPARTAEPPDDPALASAADLADTLADWVRRTSYGRGIAAPQIGIPVRLVHTQIGEPLTLVNPVIIARSPAMWQPWETCLSFSVAFFCTVARHTWIDVTYRSLDGQSHTIRADGPLGHCLQHEIDHLDGVLAVDRMTGPTSMCMRPEFERRHREHSPYRPGG